MFILNFGDHLGLSWTPNIQTNLSHICLKFEIYAQCVCLFSYPKPRHRYHKESNIFAELYVKLNSMGPILSSSRKKTSFQKQPLGWDSALWAVLIMIKINIIVNCMQKIINQTSKIKKLAIFNLLQNWKNLYFQIFKF